MYVHEFKAFAVEVRKYAPHYSSQGMIICVAVSTDCAVENTIFFWNSVVDTVLLLPKGTNV